MAAVWTPPQIPEWGEALLWSALAAWLVSLWLAGGRLGSGSLATGLCLASLPATAAMAVAVTLRPGPEAEALRLLLLWVAVALGLSGVVMWWHHRGDDEGIEEADDYPEPPWWPEFEDELRRYIERTRRRPRVPAR